MATTTTYKVSLTVRAVTVDDGVNARGYGDGTPKSTAADVLDVDTTVKTLQGAKAFASGALDLAIAEATA